MSTDAARPAAPPSKKLGFGAALWSRIKALAHMQRNSIALTLFWLSLAWLILALAGTAFLLSGLYSQALDRSLTDILRFDLESLVERTLSIGNPEDPEIGIGDPRFTRPASGWYWAIRDESGALLNLSPSTVGVELPDLTGPFDATRTRLAVVSDSFGTEMRAVERQVTVGDRTLRVLATGNLEEVFQQVEAFRGQTLIVLGAVGAMLAIMSAIVARFALRPVGRLRAALERVREGESESVTGSFPNEIAPLADEVNQLLRSNAQIIERARSQVGNLAHGLKTPLAVLRNEASAATDSPLARVVLSESEKMGTMVATYLERARLSARSAVIGKKTDPTIVMLRLARVMGKIHPNVTVAMRRPDASLPWFRGDESDFEEMTGNILDNACKWSRGEVGISMMADRRGNSVMLLVKIEDNGPGLTEDEAKQVMKRGVRLDEKTPGSGLGLDIVKELVDVYGGSLELKRSVLGGLLVEMRLPAARLGTGPRL